MPRVLLPSPNEEALILQQAQQKQKRERLIAARKQSAAWCKRRTDNHQLLCKEKQITQNVETVKNKLTELEEKENDLRNQLDNAMCDVGKGYSDANELNALQIDQRNAENLAEYSKRAAERHCEALKRLNALKEQKILQETRVTKLKQQVRTQENQRSKKLLENPQQNTQPLLEIPKAKVFKPLHGLDAFTKTYYHLPSGIGVIDEKSMAKEGQSKDAKTLAKEVEQMMEDCREKLQESKQAREERADVRGYAALEKVQLKNVLEDITTQLDKYSLYSRTKKKPSTLHTNIFASNAARINTQKQHQIDLEHAVEDIFDKHDQHVAMTLPSSVKFEMVNEDNSLETIEEKSETDSIALDSLKNHETEVVENAENEDSTDEDLLADESRPSLNLYFPVQSDLSSERSPAKEEAVNDVSDESTSSPVAELPKISRLLDQDISTEERSPEKEPTVIDLSDEIKEQLAKNEEMKEIANSLKKPTKIDICSDHHQPPPISFTKPSPNTSSNLSQSTLSSSATKSTSSSFEEIMQELLTSDQGSEIHQKSMDSSLISKMSDSLSQHTLSQDSSGAANMVKVSPDFNAKQNHKQRSYDRRNVSYYSESSINSGSRSSGSSGNHSAISVSSGLSELQKQLMKINSHLNEIEKIKDNDSKSMFLNS